MSRFVFKLPDLGEGTVEAEIVGWRVKPGDQVNEDDIVAEVMTEKAVVELSAPVTGKIVSLSGNAGDKLAVGSEFIVFETAPAAGTSSDTPAGSAASIAPPVGDGPSKTSVAPAALATTPQGAAAASTSQSAGSSSAPAKTNGASAHASAHPAHDQSSVRNGGRISTSPAIRRRAHEAGINLSQVTGSGPNGRIMRADLDAFVTNQKQQRTPTQARPSRPSADSIEEIKVIGLRRVIAQRMAESKRNIPHFAYVEEVDVTELENLRVHLNRKTDKQSSLTYLPFLVAALTRVLEDFPQCNAHYDAERNVILRHSAVHVGVATQTPDGLKVPVVRDAQARSLWDISAEIKRVSEAARTNKATRDELSGSTITVTSLGKLGGIASTPIINAPEMAIIGVNRAVERPVVLQGAITVRRIMNLSSSFDHRFVDGFDAAALIQALKERLEHPATIFIPD